MTLSAYNGATGGRLVWWLRPIGGIINLTSKCQDRTIADQLADGVKLFNLQVAFVGGKWRFTHGLAVYKEDVMLTIRQLRAWATKHKPIYFQLYLDKCFWCKQDKIEFGKLIRYIKDNYCNDSFLLLPPWIEGTNTTYKGSDCNLSWEEHYWTLAWGKMYGKTWVDKLPLPKRHAKKYNSK